MTAAELLQDLNRLDEHPRIEARAGSALLSEIERGAGESTKLPEESTKLGEQPAKLRRDPTKGAEQSTRDSEESPERERLLAELRPALVAEVEDLNRWTPQPVLRALLRRLCDSRPYSAQELAAVTGRSVGYLRNAYIRPLLRDGLIEYTNPAKPNDPNQRYRAASQGTTGEAGLEDLR